MIADIQLDVILNSDDSGKWEVRVTDDGVTVVPVNSIAILFLVGAVLFNTWTIFSHIRRS